MNNPIAVFTAEISTPDHREVFFVSFGHPVPSPSSPHFLTSVYRVPLLPSSFPQKAKINSASDTEEEEEEESRLRPPN